MYVWDSSLQNSGRRAACEIEEGYGVDDIGRVPSLLESRVVNVSSTDDVLVVELDEARPLSVPFAWYLRLQLVSHEQRGDWHVAGTLDHWAKCTFLWS